MARTGLYMNWTTVSVSYAGPTTITLTNITDVGVVRNDQYESFKGDGNIFPTAMARTNATRTMRITGGDVGKLLTIPLNTVCTVVCKLNDAKNGTSAGCITFTLANALFMGNSPSGPENTFIRDSVDFMAYSSDGTTDPLTYAEAT